jgi:excisionase family DNA binding protein
LYKAEFMGLISTSEAAERLGVHITRVQVLIREGRLPAQKIGGTYVIDEADLKLVANRKPGRPPKVKAETDSKAGKKKGGKK